MEFVLVRNVRNEQDRSAEFALCIDVIEEYTADFIPDNGAFGLTTSAISEKVLYVRLIRSCSRIYALFAIFSSRLLQL
jgi:hypothetical protein